MAFQDFRPFLKVSALSCIIIKHSCRFRYAFFGEQLRFCFIL